jgi:hypothetical protein
MYTNNGICQRLPPGAYFELRKRIDQIVAQAEQQGTLVVAVSGLNPRKAY